MFDYREEDYWPTETKRGWTVAEFDHEAATHRFSESELEVLLRLVDETKERGLAVTDITRETFDAPEVHDLLVSLVRQLKDGQGVVVLKGFPVRERDLEDMWRLYWGIGTHFGIPVSQDARGNLQGQVMVQPGTVGDRVYGTSAEAVLHSDRIDMLSLLCITKARSGGENGFASSLAVWDAIERERPDLLERLKRGYPQHRNGEQAATDSEVTPYRVPIFGEEAGLRSAYFGGNSMLSHQRKRFAELLEEEDVEALTFLREVVDRAELRLPLQLEPGEAVFLNNMELMHARAAFENGDQPHEQRRLLRLWLQGRPRRPYPADMNVIRNRSGMLGIEPKPQLVAA